MKPELYLILEIVKITHHGKEAILRTSKCNQNHGQPRKH